MDSTQMPISPTEHPKDNRSPTVLHPTGTYITYCMSSGHLDPLYLPHTLRHLDLFHTTVFPLDAQVPYSFLLQIF